MSSCEFIFALNSWVINQDFNSHCSRRHPCLQFNVKTNIVNRYLSDKEHANVSLLSTCCHTCKLITMRELNLSKKIKDRCLDYLICTRFPPSNVWICTNFLFGSGCFTYLYSHNYSYSVKPTGIQRRYKERVTKKYSKLRTRRENLWRKGKGKKRRTLQWPPAGLRGCPGFSAVYAAVWGTQ